MIAAKRLAVLLVIVLLGLTACGQKPEEAPQPGIGVCLRQETDVNTAPYRQSLEAALTEKGYTVRVADGKNDQTKQNAQIRELIEAGCDLLIIEPVMISDAASIVEQLRQADIPGVIINREPDSEILESWDKVCFVGSAAAELGQLQGQIILEQPDQGDINGDGIVSYITLQDLQVDTDALVWAYSCVKPLNLAEVETKLLEQDVGDWTKESGRQLCAEALSSHGMDIEVIFCNNDAMTLGALEAIRDGGWTAGRDVYLVGADARAETLALVQQGEITGTILNNTRQQVDTVLQVTQQLLQGEQVQRQYNIDSTPVTEQNVQSLLQEQPNP